MATAYIGCSGFSYAHWRGSFYPPDLPARHWLAHYCAHFASVELNVTFYRLVATATFARWRQETPPHFAFAVKGSRFITHVKRLVEPEAPLARFFAGVLALEEKLRVVLWQLPPGLACQPQRLERFLAALRAYPVRAALEFRHPGWLRYEVLALCRAHNVALCAADWPAFLAAPPATADFAYLRRHGRDGSYATCYTAEELAADARRLRAALAAGRDAFIYFNNDACGYAPRNALELRSLLE